MFRKKLLQLFVVMSITILLSACQSKKTPEQILTEIPEEYVKVWELEQDNILIEFYNAPNAEHSLCKTVNKNAFDVQVDVDYKYRSADLEDTAEYMMDAGNYITTAGQTYVEYLQAGIQEGTYTEENKGKAYCMTPFEKEVVNGITFEITGWNKDTSELEYTITNHLEQDVVMVELQWILFENGMCKEVKRTRPFNQSKEALHAGESVKLSGNPFDDFNAETQKIMVSYCYDV